MGEWFDVDSDAFPILVTLCPQRFSEEGIDAYRDAYLEVLRRKEPLVSVVDTRACVGFMHSDNRRYLARFGAETHEARRHLVQAIVILATDVLVRASIRAMHWLARPEQPVYFVTTERDAIEKAIAVLEASGIAPPDEAHVEGALAKLRHAQDRVSA
jgi:hypothetical protein